MGNIGQLREQIQLATKTVVRDEIGGVDPNWSLSSNIWAAVEFKATGSDERFSSDQQTAYTAANFTIRLREVSEDQEIIYRDDRYQILSVLPDAKRCYMIIETKKISSQND